MPLPSAYVNRNRSQVRPVGRRSNVTFRRGFFAGVIFVLIWGFYLFHLWQAERQIQLHNGHLIEQIERHNWNCVGDFVGDGYRDQWGNDRKLLLERLPQVFRALGTAQIETGAVAIRREGDRGFLSARITIKGTGEFADAIQNRVNSLDTPFEFEWRRGATWPWDWKLVAVRNAALEISD